MCNAYCTMNNDHLRPSALIRPLNKTLDWKSFIFLPTNFSCRDAKSWIEAEGSAGENIHFRTCLQPRRGWLALKHCGLHCVQLVRGPSENIHFRTCFARLFLAMAADMSSRPEQQETWRIRKEIFSQRIQDSEILVKPHVVLHSTAQWTEWIQYKSNKGLGKYFMRPESIEFWHYQVSW
jgi:hypothetical protein